ncbi:MAG: helix-turn-helix transcriptional regulator, partial [Lachnospiraceae bacterium]|nr:helix-turn-helix transcriptional regulator [Lachnospiraceae bacterium]
MDQVKIGKFIAACRKEQNLTQAALAEKLGITDRAVSKWENGRSLPDSSIMLELCELLSINVNELLKGERVAMEESVKVSEELILSLKQQNEEKS